MRSKPRAPATTRNRAPILQVLSSELSAAETVLEIGSGTGEHAVFFAAALPYIYWQTSDCPANHEGIRAWVSDSGLANVGDPIALDVLDPPAVELNFDAVFSANTAHIMSFEAVRCMFGIVADYLNRGGVFCLYGPFNEAGDFTSDSNRVFDRALRSQNSAMGIRDIESLDTLATDNCLRRRRRYAMPANNQLLVWQYEP